MRYVKFFKRFLSEGRRETSRHRIDWPVRGVILVFLMNPVTPLVFFGVEQAWPAEPVNPLTREYTITVDPTGLEPPTRWHVPGVTPLIVYSRVNGLTGSAGQAGLGSKRST